MLMAGGDEEVGVAVIALDGEHQVPLRVRVLHQEPRDPELGHDALLRLAERQRHDAIQLATVDLLGATFGLAAERGVHAGGVAERIAHRRAQLRVALVQRSAPPVRRSLLLT